MPDRALDCFFDSLEWLVYVPTCRVPINGEIASPSMFSRIAEGDLWTWVMTVVHGRHRGIMELAYELGPLDVCYAGSIATQRRRYERNLGRNSAGYRIALD